MLDLPLPLDREPLRLSPTDVSQFIRLEQCERYLRLRLYEHSHGLRFLRDYGVAPQPLPPLLTRSGREFEERVERELAEVLPCRNLAREAEGVGNREDDTAQVLEALDALAPGNRLALLQPRLRAEVGGWRLTGDADLIRAERGRDGCLRLLVADLKSSSQVKVEHRLQVAFYHAILSRTLEAGGPSGPPREIRTAVLYAGPPAPDPGLTEEQAARLEAHRRAAGQRLGLRDVYLDVSEEEGGYLQAVEDLVTSPTSEARRIAATPFEKLRFHLSHKCDGCLYNELCLKHAAETDDLSLLPHLTTGEKSALRRLGLRTTRGVALLKDVRKEAGSYLLDPAPGKEDLCRRVAATWPVGPRIDELVLRARQYRRWRGDALEAPSDLPGKGYGSLPYCDAQQNPNLVRVFIDAQQDYLHGRVYLLGSLVVACEGGEPARRRSVVCLTEGPPDCEERERRLLSSWIRDTLRAVVELAAPDRYGERQAPIHLIFYDAWEQRLFLEALARHLSTLSDAAPALYDFATQIAAYDSPVATFLSDEIRELRNYPMLFQSLQAVAARLKFRWSEPERYDRLFRERLFDVWRKLETEDGEPQWYLARSRFGSAIPLEYAYSAWGELPPPPPRGRDDYAPYRGVDADLLRRFQARRLEAMEHIAASFPGNRFTEKRPFRLPDLASFEDRARTLARALEEFVLLERHVELHEWKMIRHAAPERRALLGETLLLSYHDEDQDPDVAAANRENLRRFLLKEQYERELRAADPDAPKVSLTPEQRQATQFSQKGLRVRLRLDTESLECPLEEALALASAEPGSRWVLFPRRTVDSRLPPEEQVAFQPTPRQMLWGTRADLERLEVERDESGRATGGWVEVVLSTSHGGAHMRGFAFGCIDRPLEDGERYTLDPCADNYPAYWCWKVTSELGKLEERGEPERHPLYHRISRRSLAPLPWPPQAEEAQRRFLAGLEAFHARGALHDFEPSKRRFIGGHGADPILLVQGPPGTGKSYSTAFALLARLQGALAAGRDLRILLSCKTHAAIDVLLRNVSQVLVKLRELRQSHPEVFADYLDERLLEVPLFRLDPREEPPEGVTPLVKDRDKPPGEVKNADLLGAERWCVAAGTPGAIYQMVNTRWSKDLFGHGFCDCLVLDEASQMSLPEALLASLTLSPQGQVIVVGDHRQMPPIVRHDWASEPRRTFQEYRAYESLFQTLLPLVGVTDAAEGGGQPPMTPLPQDAEGGPGASHGPREPDEAEGGLGRRRPPLIQFEESFRLHAHMAEFLRREIYSRDGIPFHSRRRDLLPAVPLEDEFLAAVLAPEHPLVVVLHDEDSSQTRNSFEESLVAPLLRALADPGLYGLKASSGLGVVVPHRAQRAALRAACPELSPDVEGELSAVDTVERFQGGERTVIVVSATESDREYLRVSGRFLLDPRRLTVALSRAKRKLVLVAARSVFSHFSPDEETFANALLWKNLLRRTCTVPLWQGNREGVWVEVWGNPE